MTVSGPYIDARKPGLPYALTVRYGATNSMVEHHRYPSESMADDAREQGTSDPGVTKLGR
jgi:hypothetical protein